MATEYISSVAQERVARAIAAHTKGIEQAIIANDYLEGLIWCQTVGKGCLANLIWIIRPLIPVSNKVRQRRPFNHKAIRSARLSGGDINGYV